MTPAERSRARARNSSDYESSDDFEFSNLRAGPSGSRRSSNEVNAATQLAARILLELPQHLLVDMGSSWGRARHILGPS
jgi:hypothetical protein